MGKIISRFLMKYIALRMNNKIEQKENKFNEIQGSIKSNENSPTRFDILYNATEHEYGYQLMNFKSLPATIASMKGIERAIDDTINNPENPLTKISDELLTEMEQIAMNNGVSSFGYTVIPDELVFQNKAVLFNRAMICTFEMDAEKMAKAPSMETNVMVMEAYRDLGRATLKIAEFLREKGFAAQAGHPLNGLVLYPPLAVKAGLGMHGLQGLLITPEYGPRVRLGAVFMNIDNLPINVENEHQWIRDYCDHCRRCIDKCPGNAIYDEPIMKENGIQTHIDNKKCFPHFLTKHSCSICIKVCPFATQDYIRLKKIWENKLLNNKLDVYNNGSL